MLNVFTDSSSLSKTKIYSIKSKKSILLIKNRNRLIARSAIILNPKPIQISSLYALIDLFQDPIIASLNIPLFKKNNQECYTVLFFVDIDSSESLKGDFNSSLRLSIEMLRQKISILEKNISLKGLTSTLLSAKELVLVMEGNLFIKKIKKYSYQLVLSKEKELVKQMIFSNGKIKKIDLKRDSVIPETLIPLGKTISNKDIGVNDHILFLTGNKNFRREIIQKILLYYTTIEDYHLVVIDFGLGLNLENTFSRKFTFDDVSLDPFSFKSSFSSSQQSLFVSHLSFISKNILRLNDRQISLLEEKITLYFENEHNYSFKSFLTFLQGETNESTILNNPVSSSFTSDISASDDYTAIIKKVDSNTKSSNLEALVNKFTFVNHLFRQDSRDSFLSIFAKNHLDIFSITVAPDQKALFFYIFNLFYFLNNSQFKNFKFFFLDADSILFENFKDIEISWIHPELQKSLFDTSDIYSTKKLYSILETRIYASTVTNAPYSIVSKVTLENIEKLQTVLKNYYLIEGPHLSGQEFFKITKDADKISVELPEISLFRSIVKVIFANKEEFLFKELLLLYDINRSLLHQLINNDYLKKKNYYFIVTSKARKLKKVIIDYLAYQPNLTMEENDFLIRITNPKEFNVFKQEEFSFSINIENISSRLLANQLLDFPTLNIFLLYQFLAFKKNIIDEKKLAYYLVVSMQSVIESQGSLKVNYPSIETSDSQNQETESMQDYFDEIKDALVESSIDDNSTISNNQSNSIKINNLITVNKSIKKITYPDSIQECIDRINERITSKLTDSGYKFPDKPIFLIMKFLDRDSIDLLLSDLQELNSMTAEICKLEV